MKLCIKKKSYKHIDNFNIQQALVNKDLHTWILLKIFLDRFSACYFSQPDLAVEATVLLFASCALAVLMECLRHHANQPHVQGPFPLRAELERCRITLACASLWADVRSHHSTLDVWVSTCVCVCARGCVQKNKVFKEKWIGFTCPLKSKWISQKKHTVALFLYEN